MRTVFEYQDGRVLFEHNRKELKAVPFKEVSAPKEEMSWKELLAALINKGSGKSKKKYISLESIILASGLEEDELAPLWGYDFTIMAPPSRMN